MRIELPHRYVPRHYQAPLCKAILEDEVKRAVTVWHRRAGKDKTFLNLLATMAMKVSANYAYYFPTAALGRKALWQNIDPRTGMKVIDHIPAAIIARRAGNKPDINEQLMRIRLVNGSTIQVLGTDNLDVVGGNYYGVIFSECGQQNPLAWDYTRPILRENGGWALFNGTPRGRNWFHRLAMMAATNPDWFYSHLTVDDTGVLTPQDIDSERREGMREELIQQEYFCDWSVGVAGAIYAKEMDQAEQAGRICEFEPHRGALVHTTWDIGSPANTAIVYFQRIGPALQIIDFDFGLRMTTAERVAHMKAKPFAPLYGHHCLPHDAAAVHAGGLSFQQELEAAGLPNTALIPKTVDVERRINGMTDRFPNTWFRKSTTEKLRDALIAFHRKEDQASGYVADKIVHDWASHPSDAFGYIAEAEEAGLIDTPPMRSGARKKPIVRGLATTGSAVKRKVTEDDDW